MDDPDDAQDQRRPRQARWWAKDDGGDHDLERSLLTPGQLAAMNMMPRRGNRAKVGPAMWTRAMLLLTLVAVVLPLALLLGIHFGTAWVEQLVLP
jgi:hypothetical protein